MLDPSPPKSARRRIQPVVVPSHYGHLRQAAQRRLDQELSQADQADDPRLTRFYLIVGESLLSARDVVQSALGESDVLCFVQQQVRLQMAVKELIATLDRKVVERWPLKHGTSFAGVSQYTSHLNAAAVFSSRIDYALHEVNHFSTIPWPVQFEMESRWLEVEPAISQSVHFNGGQAIVALSSRNNGLVTSKWVIPDETPLSDERLGVWMASALNRLRQETIACVWRSGTDARSAIDHLALHLKSEHSEYLRSVRNNLPLGGHSSGQLAAKLLTAMPHVKGSRPTTPESLSRTIRNWAKKVGIHSEQFDDAQVHIILQYGQDHAGKNQHHEACRRVLAERQSLMEVKRERRK